MGNFGMSEFIEQRIIDAVRGLLLGRVNELLKELQFYIPVIEFGKTSDWGSVDPVVSLSGCEQSEKERLIKIEAYSLTITFNVPEFDDSQLFCYAYATAFGMALAENPTLGGVASRAILSGKKYIQPKKAHCGEEWGLVISLRISVEEMRK